MTPWMLVFMRPNASRTTDRCNVRAQRANLAMKSAFFSVPSGAVLSIAASISDQIEKSSGIHEGVRGGNVRARMWAAAFDVNLK